MTRPTCRHRGPVDILEVCVINQISSSLSWLAFLQGQRGGPKFLERRVRGRGERLSRLVGMAKVTFKTEPVS